MGKYFKSTKKKTYTHTYKRELRNRKLNNISPKMETNLKLIIWFIKKKINNIKTKEKEKR